MSMTVPVDELREQLAAARAGFDGWAKAQTESVAALQVQHLSVMREADEQAKELRAEQDHYGEAAEKLQKLLAEQREELNALSKELAHVKAEEENWPFRLAKLTEEIEQMEALNEAEKAELEDEETIKKGKAEALLAFKEKYRKHLGLNFEHPAKDQFKLVFVNVDPAAPQREFAFILHVSDNYSVVECTPKVTRLEELLVEVNKSNDFSLFVRTMRKEFQASCEQQQYPVGKAIARITV